MSEEIIIDVGALFRALKKHFKIIIGVAILCALVGLIYCKVKTPVYISYSSVRIQQPSSLKNFLEQKIINSSLINIRIYTYTEILKSRSVVQKVIEENQITDSSGKLISYNDYLKNNLVTEMVRDTEILQIAIKDLEPERAQRINKKLIEEFLNRLTELARGQQKNTREFLEERVKISQKDLTAAETALNNFKRDNVIYTPDARMERLSHQMTLIDKMQAENQFNLESAQSKNSVVNSQIDNNMLAFADNTTLRNYQNKIAELEAQRIEYLEKYTEEHPKVKEITEAIANIKKELDGEIKRIINREVVTENEVYEYLLRDKFTSEADIKVAKNNLAILDEIAAQYQTELADLSDTERQYLKLTRDLSLAQEIYVMLSKNLEEARVAEASISNEVQLIDEPSFPQHPSEPRMTRVIPIAFIAGLFFACFAVIIRELYNSTFRKAEEIREVFKLPVLGEIPFDKKKNVNLTDFYMKIAMNFKHLLKSEPQIITVVSAVAKEGRSSIVKNLGSTLASENFKVVIVNGDLRNPAQLFDVPSAPGITEKFSDLAEVVQKTKTENLFVIPSNSTAKNPARLLSDKVVAENLLMLKENFDLILIDTPPMLNFPDALILNDCADGLILVVEANKTKLKSVREVKLQLEQVNGNIIGIILNKVRE